MHKTALLLTLSFFTVLVFAQAPHAGIYSLSFFGDVTVTIDQPLAEAGKKPLSIIFYALPNGNSIAQTMGKIMQPGDDWHFDIQHIKAQTAFVRKSLKKENIVVCYLWNQYKSWPLWKQKHPDYRKLIPSLVDSVYNRFHAAKKTIQFISHSGGGSFIFGYLDGVVEMPDFIKRVSFIDSNYGYDSSYATKIIRWLKKVHGSKLLVFAYNDSVALYNGKPVVSATGGTWHRSHLMMDDVQHYFTLKHYQTDSLLISESRKKNVAFFLKPNPDRGIYHTQQVELNGFIHAVLYGTPKENKGYGYFQKRSYTLYITNETE